MRTVYYRLLIGTVAVLASVSLHANELPDSVRSAIAEQQTLIAEQPNNADAYNDLGNLLLLGSEPELAEIAYRRATTLDERSISGHFNLGLLLAQRNDLKGARQQFDRVLSLDPIHAWSHFQIGRLDEIDGKTARAITSYSEAFRLDPTLSFSDLNPQVLDSRLTTRALLAIDAGSGSASEAPRAYEDPFRIAGLLLPKLPEEEEAAEQPADSTLESTAGPGRLQDDSEDRPTEGKTLRRGDLDRNSKVGEADPPGVAIGGSSRTRPSRTPTTLQRPGTTNRGGSSGHLGGRSNDESSASALRSTGQIRTRTRQN